MHVFYVSKSSHPEVFLGKGVLKICSKFTGERPCRSAISIKLQSNFIEITFRHECSPVNLLNIFRTPFLMNTSGRLLLCLLSRKNWLLKHGCFWQMLLLFLYTTSMRIHIPEASVKWFSGTAVKNYRIFSLKKNYAESFCIVVWPQPAIL